MLARYDKNKYHICQLFTKVSHMATKKKNGITHAAGTIARHDDHFVSSLRTCSFRDIQLYLYNEKIQAY